jgi:hypothetical protein
MMTMTSSRFRFSWLLAPRLLPLTVTLIKAEYERAILAARYYDSLKNRSAAEPRRLRIQPHDISRAVFEAVYSERPNVARSGAA